MRQRFACILLALALPVLGYGQSVAAAASTPVIVVEFSNPALSPSHWVLTLHPGGKAHFRSEAGRIDPAEAGKIHTSGIDRDIELSAAFAASVFETAGRHSYFNESCESHLKVAFQGTKTLSYAGPAGKGSCSFNYSRDREIQALGDSFLGVAETVIEGGRLETLLQHDPLGLDKEMAALSDAAESGRALQLCAIRPILDRLAQDERVLDIVRKRARALLAQAGI
jgi:hypothetical protein